MESMNPKRSSTGEAGYSLIELLVVVGLIVVMAAMAAPNIFGYIRNYRVRGATQEIASELTTARNRAITRNTNAGISFRIYDSNTYRIFEVPMVGLGSPTGTPGPLRTLPVGVAFLPGTGTQVAGMAFDRLGRPCPMDNVTVGCPTWAQTAPACVEAECSDRGPANTYVGLTGGTYTITVVEERTQIRRNVFVASGGRVTADR